METKIVFLPITVPKNNYCYRRFNPFTICSYYNNERSQCTLGFAISYNLGDSGFKKPFECQKLKTEMEEKG